MVNHFFSHVPLWQTALSSICPKTQQHEADPSPSWVHPSIQSLSGKRSLWTRWTELAFLCKTDLAYKIKQCDHAKNEQAIVIPKLFEKLFFVSWRPLLSENSDCALIDHGLILSVVYISVAVNYRPKQYIIGWEEGGVCDVMKTKLITNPYFEELARKNSSWCSGWSVVEK